MPFVIDDAIVASATEAAIESGSEVASGAANEVAAGLESTTELSPIAESDFSVEEARNEFSPDKFGSSEAKVDLPNSNPELNSSISADNKLEALKNEFTPSEFSETTCNTTIEQDIQVNTVERTSTFEEQTISNDKLEEKRSEIEGKLNLQQPHSADVLRGNMEVAMGTKTDSTISRAHHIVGNETPNAAKKMEAYGIDRNDPANGILLPHDASSPLKGSIHSGRHIQEYYNTVEQRMAMATNKEEVLEVLQSLKEDLFTGDLPLQRDVPPNL